MINLKENSMNSIGKSAIDWNQCNLKYNLYYISMQIYTVAF